jgi:hypothetical protein
MVARMLHPRTVHRATYPKASNSISAAALANPNETAKSKERASFHRPALVVAERYFAKRGSSADMQIP